MLDDYLPHLCGIIAAFDAGETVLTSEPGERSLWSTWTPISGTHTPQVFSWRSTLSANLFNTSPRQSVPSLQADLAFTLLTYAFALSNLARSTVGTLGNYERERAISDIERKAKDERLNFAVTLLCRASGVFRHVSERVLPEWAKYGSSEAARPPDVTQEVTSALSKYVSAPTFMQGESLTSRV